ncbi:uncharacterized protein LOC141629159 [Silene latifolia]|uniref:uncharacterized protein LOC141629159 n=1 Tax=Silene latifolia TaxID=37657 RepID=UPI003D7836B7
MACKFYNAETGLCRCRFFEWIDEDMTYWQISDINGLLNENKSLKNKIGEMEVLSDKIRFPNYQTLILPSHHKTLIFPSHHQTRSSHHQHHYRGPVAPHRNHHRALRYRPTTTTFPQSPATSVSCGYLLAFRIRLDAAEAADLKADLHALRLQLRKGRGAIEFKKKITTNLQQYQEMDSKITDMSNEIQRLRAHLPPSNPVNSSLEDVITWIVDHENGPDIDQMPLQMMLPETKDGPVCHVIWTFYDHIQGMVFFLFF